MRRCRPAPFGVRHHPFSAPSVVDMMRFWKMKNTIATGIVISTAAASLSGNCVPEPSAPTRASRHRS